METTYLCLECGEPTAPAPNSFCSDCCRITHEVNIQWRRQQNSDFYDKGVGIPDRQMTPWRDDIAPYAPKLRRAAEQFVHDFDDHEKNGLYLCGRTGIGKSRVAALVAELAHLKQRSVRWFGCPLLFARMRDTMNPGRGETELDILRELNEPDLLILDDLGAERPSSWVLEKLYLCINERFEARKKIVATSNFTLRDLSAHWGQDIMCANIAERIISRIGGMCREVSNFGEKDLRRL